MNKKTFIKTPEEIEKMRISGALAAEVLEMIAAFVEPGITTNELNRICHDYIVQKQKAIPAPLNYHGFPKSICTSINHEVCHGIPSDIRLKKGDILNIDVTVLKDGYHGDTSQMFYVGKVHESAQRLCKITQACMYLGIQEATPGQTLGDVGHVIQQHAHQHHYSVVREYCGHGIGKEFHESPQVLHFGEKNTGQIIYPGMCFTIEPMINLGKRHVKLLSDQWTVITKDYKLSAQWEHTILITENGPEILTLRSDEKPVLTFS